MSINRESVIDLIRIYLIIALICCHAFAPFSGAWQPINSESVQLYKWFARLAYASLLETFVLISGFLYCRKQHELIPLHRLFSNKFKRLYIPTIIFGIIYAFILGIEFNMETVFRILNGIGNLWFLPMLLWTFIIYSILKKFITNDKVVTIILIFLAVLPYPTLPLQLNNTMYYLFFFHIGCLLAKYVSFNENIKKPMTTGVLLVLYIILFIISYFIRDNYLFVSDNLPILKKAFYILLRHVCLFSYSCIGALLIYSLFSMLSKCYKENLTSLANLCFGIYLVHEMILRLLYYRWHLVDYVGILCLPWLSIFITLFLSVLSVRFLKLFKITRYII